MPTSDPAFEPFTLVAADGAKVPADLFRARGVTVATVVMAPAMGVPRRFYRPFCSYLAEAGLTVVSIDYRGVGEAAPKSLLGFQATLHDWAELDLRAAVTWLREQHPALPLLWVGHSVGGQLLAWMQRPPVDRALFVAAQSGHWRNWDGLRQAAMFFLWHAFIPVSVRLTGRLPMSAVGQGEDVPAGVARQWAQWGRHPRYLAAFARPGNGLETWTGTLRAYSITDDNLAPERSVRGLVDEFKKATKEIRVVKPAELGLKQIGHFGAFRPASKDLWKQMRDWLVDGLAAEDVRVSSARN